jgi:hypothetical protein
VDPGDVRRGLHGRRCSGVRSQESLFLTRSPAWTATVLSACLTALALPPTLAGRETLELHHQRLALPGAPALITTTDLNGDGLQDLLLVLAYTELETIGADRIEDLVQVSTVIPALFDRREVWAYLARPEGGFVAAGPPLPLPPSVLAIDRGPGPYPALALTDEGVVAIRLTETGGAPELQMERLLDDPPVLAGTETFFSELRWVADVNDDGAPDLLLPTPQDVAIYLFDGTDFAKQPVQRVPLPTSDTVPDGLGRDYPIARPLDVDGDGLTDLVFEGNRRQLDVVLGLGGGRFGPLDEDPECPAAATRLVDGGGSELEGALVHFGDVNGDGRAEAVTRKTIDRGAGGWRKEMKESKKPRQEFRFYRLEEEGALAITPYEEFTAIGHDFEDVDFGANTMSLFQDLDGDGREDLVTVTLRFSVLQVLRILTTKRVSVGLDFHVWAQADDGSFAEVEGLDLSEKLRFDLNDLKLGRLAQFAGDFDGDGRLDFVHLGRGRTVTIHRGQPGCRYAKKPDLEIELDEEPQDLGLVRVRDLDGDGRADLAIVRLLPVERQDETPPVQLDLYLSGGVAP